MSDSEASNDASPTRTVIVDALNYLNRFVPIEEPEFAEASAPVLFAEAEDRVRAVADAARRTRLELIWVFDNGQATDEAKAKWLERRLAEVTQARRGMPCSADTVFHALLQRAGFTVLYPPDIDGDDAVALLAWKLDGVALSGDRDLLRYGPELPRSRVHRNFAIDEDSGELILEPQGAPLPEDTAPRSLPAICDASDWPGPTRLCARWGMNAPTLCAKARSGAIKKGNADSFTAAHGNLHVDALGMHAAVYAQLGLADAVTVELPEALDDGPSGDGNARAVLAARKVLPDACTAKRIVASSTKLARRWLYAEASLPDTPEGKRERAHAVCMIAAETVDAMWFAQGNDRCVAKGALYSPAVRTLTLYNKLVCTDPHLSADDALRRSGGQRDWCALMRCKGVHDPRDDGYEGCTGSGYTFPSQRRTDLLARGKNPLCRECLSKVYASTTQATVMRCEGLYNRRMDAYEGCVGSGHVSSSRQRAHERARGRNPLCPECLAKLRASIQAAERRRLANK